MVKNNKSKKIVKKILKNEKRSVWNDPWDVGFKDHKENAD
jgi:hypothetical protein